MDNLVTVTLSNARGQVKLNPTTIHSIRPRTTGSGSVIVCIGGAVYCVEESLVG